MFMYTLDIYIYINHIQPVYIYIFICLYLSSTVFDVDSPSNTDLQVCLHIKAPAEAIQAPHFQSLSYVYLYCMYIYIYTHMCIYIYTHTHRTVSIYIYVYIYHCVSLCIVVYHCVSLCIIVHD